MRRLVWFSMAAIIVAGCHVNVNRHDERNRRENSYTKYASGFDVTDHGSFKLLQVYDPWQNSRGVSFSYVIAENRSLVPDSLKNLIYIRIPVKRVITLSTTHVAMIHQLDRANSIIGVSGTEFIYNPDISGRIESGDVEDVGYDQGLNYETIVRLDPDVLFMYGVEGNVRATSEKLSELEIPVVFCGEYLETHPLGKAEWIRFFSLFYGLEATSDGFFERLDSTYNSLVELTSHLNEKPLVLTGLPWKDTWYMAGGKSFAAKLIEDAGGDYLWSDHPSTEALPLDLESVFSRSIDAQIWINPGSATSISELNRFDERFSDLRVLQTGMVFNNSARVNAGGGNDYWESGTVRPDLVLADLISAFHPDLLPDHQFIYYRQLK